MINPDDTATERKGGWVRGGDPGSPENAIFDDFLEPARAAGQGVHLKNIYNDYVYFWRWALWKVLEDSRGPGIISYITASSYLRGPGFVGMRQVMRQLFDELWIIDLEGDNLGARKTENVFQIQTPVAIAVGIRHGDPTPETPAIVRYTKITGTREEKLDRLASVSSFDDLDWRDCFAGWMQPFLPEGQGDYFDWPLLTDLFPWQHSGVQFKRTWPIAPTEEVLQWRWRRLLESSLDERAQLFRETRDRKITRTYRDIFDGAVLPAIAETEFEGQQGTVQRYSYRSFDRQFATVDSRVGDYLKPALWHCHGPQQLYLVSFLTDVLGEGPAATISALVPDLHCFRGSFGGKHVVPLWRDSEGQTPNVTTGILDRLRAEYGGPVGAEDLMSYCYGVLASPAYVEWYSEELTIPGPHIPMTRDPALFREVVDLGRRLIWLHTFGERIVPEGETPGRVSAGTARCVRAIPANEAGYPTEFAYDEERRELIIGAGLFAPVAPEVFHFSVSGLQVVESWLSYRMRDGAGRRSSPLDEIRPRRWTAAMTDELLAVLSVLEHTVALYPELEQHLARIIDGHLFSAGDFPVPTDAEREPPDLAVREDGQLGLGV